MQKNLSLKNIKGVSSDSRSVEPGYAFVAIKGQNFNGETYIDEAIKRGASYIIVSEDSQIDCSTAQLIKVKEPREYLAALAKQLTPGQPENTVAVTGTNGKTSVAFFFKQLAKLQGFKSAAIGTLGVLTEDYDFDNSNPLTSPDPVTLHKALNKLAEHGVTHAALEASSHGLDQHRLDSVLFKAAGFTNFTRDHLDYHTTMEDYFIAKCRLFRDFAMNYAILNADIPEFIGLQKIASVCGLKVLSYGQNAKEIKLIKKHNKQIELEVFGKKHFAEINLEGDFQIHNSLCALGLTIATGLDPSKAIADLSKLVAAPGRMEKIMDKAGAKIFVDYAHTPDALENTLKSARTECNGKLWIVFGCGGDRDPGKRPIMGKIAQRYADMIVITDDNPRTEDATAIRKQIMSATPQAIEIGDRYNAIKHAMNNLNNGDVLIIAGKGHEDYQIIGTEKLHFSDHQSVIKIAELTL